MSKTTRTMVQLLSDSQAEVEKEKREKNVYMALLKEALDVIALMDNINKP